MRRWLALFVVIGLLPVANAQPTSRPGGYPTKLVRVVVPYGPGGAADLLSRIVGERLTAFWGQPVLVENRAGANGAIGIEAVTKAAPDGYTLVCVPVSNLAVNPHLYPKLGFDVFRDLAPVTLIAQVQNVLVVGPELKVSTVRELVALGKARRLTYASPGVGSQAHLAGEMFNTLTGIGAEHIVYNGVGAAIKDVLGGQVSLTISQMQAALPLVKAGKLQALGVASPKRSPLLPEVPTIAEQTGAAFETLAWSAFMAPAGTPEEIRRFIAAETRRALAAPEVEERLRSLGAEPVGSAPEELASTMRAEHARYGEVIRRAGVKPE